MRIERFRRRPVSPPAADADASPAPEPSLVHDRAADVEPSPPAVKGRRRLWRTILPILVVAAGVAGTMYLIQTKPVLEPSAPKETVWTVSATTVARVDVRPDLRLYGQIIAGREVDLRALVAGEVVAVGAGFRNGGTVAKGDLLVRIDPFEYQATLDERVAQLAEAKARLDEIGANRESDTRSLVRDREMLAIRQRDVDRAERLNRDGNVSDRVLDGFRMELSRQQQIVTQRENAIAMQDARLAQQRAIIDRLGVAVRRARRDLQRTELTAPFNGFVADVAAEVGKRLGVNDRVARLIDADRLEFQAQLSDAQYGRLLSDDQDLVGRPLTVTWRVGPKELDYAGSVDRVSATIDASTGGVEIYGRLDAAGLDLPIRPGAFVEIRLPDRHYRGVVRVAESALYDDRLVYVVVDGRAEKRAVTVAGRVGDDVLIAAGLADGEQVVTTRFAEIGPGVRVEVR